MLTNLCIGIMTLVNGYIWCNDIMNCCLGFGCDGLCVI